MSSSQSIPNSPSCIERIKRYFQERPGIGTGVKYIVLIPGSVTCFILIPIQAVAGAAFSGLSMWTCDSIIHDIKSDQRTSWLKERTWKQKVVGCAVSAGIGALIGGVSPLHSYLRILEVFIALPAGLFVANSKRIRDCAKACSNPPQLEEALPILPPANNQIEDGALHEVPLR